jgi:diguanylate cyclase (GGDEF)-like protein
VTTSDITAPASTRDPLAVIDAVGDVLALNESVDGEAGYGGSLGVLGASFDASFAAVTKFNDDGALIVGFWDGNRFVADANLDIGNKLLPPGAPVRNRRVPMVFEPSEFSGAAKERLEAFGPGQSLLVAPIVEADIVVGGIVVLAPGMVDLSDSDRVAIQLCGELIWRHMRHHESSRELNERVEVAEIVARIGGRLHEGGIGQAREVLDEAFEALGSATGSDVVVTYEREGNSAEGTVGWSNGRWHDVATVELTDDEWLLIEGGLAFEANDDCPVAARLAPGLQSGVILPGVIDGEVVGAFLVGCRETRLFRPAQIDLISAVARLLGQFRNRMGAEFDLVRRGVVEQSRTEIAEAFINAPAEDIDETVLHALESVGQVFNVRRVRWVEVDTAELTASLVLEWDDGSRPAAPTDFAMSGGLSEAHHGGREPFLISPDEIAEFCGTKTNSATLVVPAVVGEHVVAALSLTGIGIDKELVADERRALMDLSGLILQARERARQTLASKYRQVLDELQLRLGGRFLDRSAVDVREVLDWALGEIGDVLDCDLIAFCEYVGTADGDLHWWARSNSTIATGVSDAFMAGSEFLEPHFSKVLESGEPTATRSVLLPQKDREVLERMTGGAPLSMLVVPFRARGIGLLLGLSVFRDREWSPAEMAMLTQLVGQVRQFIDVVAGRRQLQYDATHDSLTSLANRRKITDDFNELIAEGRSGAMLMIDVDRFKVVNDSLGHSAGDAVLVAIAERIRASVREQDLVGRLGGDEFGILVRDDESDLELAATAARLIEVVREPIIVRGTTVIPTCSIGIARTGPSDDVESVIRHADAALYDAKANGRDRYEFFDDAHRETLRARLHLETALRRGVSNGEFVPWFQPEYDLIRNEIIGVEALVRWNHPTEGVVDAVHFIDTAEEIGLAPEMSRIVVDKSFAVLREWISDGFDTRMRVNVAAAQLQSNELAEQISVALDTYGIPADLLCIEITERSLMLDLDSAIEALGEVRRLGVEVAVDDFGTGFSSLARLKHLPVDTLKIDRSFVNGIVTSATDREIVRTIIWLSRGLGLDVVAEGVEHAEQVEMLLELGCRRAQGWLWSPAVPAESVPRLARI